MLIEIHSWSPSPHHWFYIEHPFLSDFKDPVFSLNSVFLVVMYGCESWTVKKAECRRIDAFELWCRRRLFRVPLIARRSNQQMDFRMFCIYAFKSLKSIFVFDPVILTLIKLQRNSLDKTSQIWNFALTISFSTACNLCTKQGKNIEVFTFPRKIWDLLNLGQHSFILFMK